MVGGKVSTWRRKRKRRGKWDVIGNRITDHGTRRAQFFLSQFSLSLSLYPLSLFIYLLNMAGRKTLLAPIHFIFSLLQKRTTVSIWLYEQLAFRIEGKIRVGSFPLCSEQANCLSRDLTNS